MIFLKTALLIGVIQAICSFFAIRFRTDKLTDAAYWWTFFLVVLWLYLRESTGALLHTLVLVLLSCWALRLAVYLFLRVLALWKDKRFDGIRENKHSFMKFWIGQWAVIFLLFVPVVRMFSNGTPATLWYTIGWIIMSMCGILLESVADRQKFRFKQQYPTKRCNVWVRSKVQYPNYLWEILVWVGIYLICLSSLTETQAMLWLISPFTITRLLLFVTWIPPLARSHKQQWWDDREWISYVEKTPKILPYIY